MTPLYLGIEGVILTISLRKTKAQDNICTGSDRPQSSGLYHKIYCLMMNWPYFLIKYNFISSLFDEITTVFTPNLVK
jgi:hypothetical protein